MHELDTGEVVDFVRGGLSTQDRVAMRVTTEARNDVSMSTGLRPRVLEHPAKLWRGAFDEPLCERGRPLEVRELLRFVELYTKVGH